MAVLTHFLSVLVLWVLCAVLPSEPAAGPIRLEVRTSAALSGVVLERGTGGVQVGDLLEVVAEGVDGDRDRLLVRLRGLAAGV